MCVSFLNIVSVRQIDREMAEPLLFKYAIAALLPLLSLHIHLRHKAVTV